MTRPAVLLVLIRAAPARAGDRSHGPGIRRTLPHPGILLILLLAASSCRGTQPSRPATAPATPSTSTAAGRITATGADRIRLGMTAGQVLAGYGDRARRATVPREGMNEPVIQVRDSSGRLLLTADLADGRVTRIHVRDPDLTTAQGVRVGTPLRTLERRYGKGQVLVGEGNVCVVFPRTVPGLSFCLADAYRLVTGGRPPTWDRVRRANPRVETILVVGSPSAADAVPRDKREGLENGKSIR